MKKVNFYAGTKFLGTEKEETVYFPDDTDKRTIDSAFKMWMDENVDYGWEYESEEDE